MSVQGMLLIFIFFAFVQGSSSSSCDAEKEPCFLYNNVEIPHIQTRHPDIEPSPETIAEGYCDLFALDPNIWYRSTYNMTTHVVQWQGCGTNYPIWLNGTIPRPTDGIVSSTACVRGLFEECEMNYTIQIKNCNYFTVYCFPNVPNDCHQRYCFDIDRKETTYASRMSSVCSECSSQGQMSRKGFFQNSLAVFLVTFCSCTAVFGVTMVTVLYNIKRKVCLETNYAYRN